MNSSVPLNALSVNPSHASGSSSLSLEQRQLGLEAENSQVDESERADQERHADRMHRLERRVRPRSSRR